MADYHPLILRAVEGLDKNTGENRRALYERARIALVSQLRGVQPALDESEITRERLALEEAIRKVEAESARKAREEPRSPPPPRAPPPPRREPPAARPAPPPPEPERHAPEPYTPPPPPPPPQPRERAPLSGNQPSLSDQALKGFRDSFGADAPPPAPRAETPRPTPPRPVPPSSAPPSSAPPRPETPRPEYRRPERPVSRPVPPPPPPAQEAHPLHEYGQLEPDVQPENLWDKPPPAAVDFDATRPPSGRPRPQQYEPDEAEEPPRRAARAPREPGAYSGLIKVIAIFAVIGIIGALAFWQRNAIMGAASSVVAMVRGTGTTSTPAPRPTTDPNARPKIPDRIGQPSQSAGPAVAQRVVLYEEDPDDPQGKRSVGSAIWRTEMTQPAPGRPAELMVKADIEIPDRRMTVSWAFRRNTDQSLPASHTIEIVFNMPADSPAGGVQNVPGVLMKQAEQTRGVPLSGLAVKVTPGFFLIGLSAVEADMQRNLQLLKERAWFDIPIVYNNNRRAILAVEKGTPGERAFSDAFAAWKQ